MKKQKIILIFSIVFLLNSCSVTSDNWRVIYNEVDYDLLQYDVQSNRIWASNFFGKDLISIQLSNDLMPQKPIKQAPLPDGLSLNTFCFYNDYLWIISNGILIRYSPDLDVWENYTQINLDSFLFCQTLNQGKMLFVGKKEGKNIFVIYEKGIESIYIDLPYLPNSIAQDSSNQLWFITLEHGLWKLDEKNQWMYWQSINGEKLFFTNPDTIWVARNNMLYYSKIEEELNFEIVTNFKYDLSLSIYQGSDDRIWIVTQSGIWEYRSDKIKRMLQPFNITHINIFHEFNPNNNTLFVSTEKGIYMVLLK